MHSTVAVVPLGSQQCQHMVCQTGSNIQYLRICPCLIFFHFPSGTLFSPHSASSAMPSVKPVQERVCLLKVGGPSLGKMGMGQWRPTLDCIFSDQNNNVPHRDISKVDSQQFPARKYKPGSMIINCSGPDFHVEDSPKNGSPQSQLV